MEADVLKYEDTGFNADFAKSPPQKELEISKNTKFNCGAYTQKRMILGQPSTKKDLLVTSVAGTRDSFKESIPRNPTDSLQFSFHSMIGAKHLKEFRHFFNFDEQGIFLIGKNQDGVLTETPNDTKISSMEIGHLPPLELDNSLLFIKHLSSRVFNLEIEGNNIIIKSLTSYVNHFFEGYSIIDYCVQSDPDNLIWFVRSDGKLLTLTYIEEQNILAWGICPMKDKVFTICSAMEQRYVGNELRGVDSLYLGVERNGKYLMERSAIRQTTVQEEMVFMESAVSFEMPVTPPPPDLISERIDFRDNAR